jgi:hypothetical protein
VQGSSSYLSTFHGPSPPLPSSSYAKHNSHQTGIMRGR